MVFVTVLIGAFCLRSITNFAVSRVNQDGYALPNAEARELREYSVFEYFNVYRTSSKQDI